MLHNSLTTDNECTHNAIFTACYQLAQSVLKLSLGDMGRFQHRVPCTWYLPWLAVNMPWSALPGPFLFFKWKYRSYKVSIASEGLLENDSVSNRF